jgi:hypothetical protein
MIMVQIADREWTLGALQRACALARAMPAQICLVHMVPVQAPGWLGTDLGYLDFDTDDAEDLATYIDMIETADVACTPLVFQYVTLADAIAQAAEHVDAQIVFAKIPQSIVPFWTSLQWRLLDRQLVRQGRRLFKPNAPVRPAAIEGAGARPNFGVSPGSWLRQ